jgi:hypothetical protein
MAETFKQYKRRILGYLGKQDPLKVWRATPNRLTRLIRGLPGSRLRRRPAPGKWSVTEILAHLSEIEIVIGYRLRNVLATNRVRIQAMNEKAWADSGKYARRDPRRSLALFRTLRASNLALMNSVPRSKWKNYGHHEERGKETIADMLRLYAGHDLNHRQQIERILRR